WKAAYGDLLPASALDLPLDQVAAVWLNAIEAPPSPQHRVLVALEQAEVVGFAASEPADEAIELSSLLVLPQWGRHGHGSRLLTACADHWRGDGSSLALAWVFEADTVLLAFLESSGWALDGAGRGLDTGERVLPQRRLHTAL
ncbi:MAG: family acetyltransferase, partial [Frankiales bacterium]|nr:family acetyltransferase [Frankiales bacterium]